MDHIELAQRRYRQILAGASDPYLLHSRRALDAWLRGDVLTAVEPYIARPAFQASAAWSLRTLTAGADTPERKLIEAIDAAAVDCARAFLRLEECPAISQELVRQNPPRLTVVKHEAIITAGSRTSRVIERTSVDSYAIELDMVREVGNRFWGDLVCGWDYFYPRGTWMEEEREPGIRGEFVVSFNPDLHAIGDYVMRCLLVRVDCLHDRLSAFWVRCWNALRRVPRKYPAREREALASMTEFRTLRSKLRQAIATGEESRIRDSCVILTQVYVGTHPRPDCSWLGLPDSLVLAGRSHGAEAGGWSAEEKLDRVAAALGDLRRLYPSGSSQQSAVEEAIAAGGLVLADGPVAYWEGKRIECDWRRNCAPWKLLWHLACLAPQGRAVTELDMYDETPASGSTMANLVSRLRKVLPGSLHRHIRPGMESRSYRLNLDARQVCIFAEPPRG